MGMNQAGEGECWYEEGAGQRERKGRKKWENCNSIINQIYFKKYKEVQWFPVSEKGSNEE